MAKHIRPVGPLKKVSLEITVGTTPELKDLGSNPESVEFIFGIGVDGLTPFECAIEGKIEGEESAVKVQQAELNEFFGRLVGCISKFSMDADPLFINYKIRSVSDSSPREVVKAMAGGSGCGGSCDCGCTIH